jgi:uncharacterized membrane protein
MITMRRIFLRGLLALLPLAVTVSLVVWLTRGMEFVFGFAVRQLISDNWYVPGMGVLVGIGFIFVMGLLLEAWFIRKIWEWGESLFETMPLVRDIYGSLRRMVKYFGGEQQSGPSKAVTITVGDPPVRLLGLVTMDDMTSAPSGLGDEDTVAVYLPMSYQMGGFTVYVPRSKIAPVDMSAKEALQWAVTAGVSSGDGE